jgi:hypothetical protein
MIVTSRVFVQGQAEPDADGREQQCKQPAVDLNRVLDDEEAVLDEAKGGDEQAAGRAEETGWDAIVARPDRCSSRFISGVLWVPSLVDRGAAAASTRPQHPSPRLSA